MFLNMKKKWNTEKFIETCKIIHNSKYSYEKTKYINSYTKVIITCPIHGDFEQKPNHHKDYKAGCKKCGRIKNLKSIKKDINHFIKKANKTHGDKYDYSESVYLGVNKLIKIKCKKCNEFFKQTPNSHYKHGHKKCNKGKHRGHWTKEKWTEHCLEKGNNSIIYLLKFYNESEIFYKVGITSNSIEKRYRSTYKPSDYKIETILEIKNTPEFCWDLENLIKIYFKDITYIPKIKFVGYTECYKDYKLINKYIKNYERQFI